MPWIIKCIDPECKKETRVANIVDLISKHRDKNGWFLCQCGKNGYIFKQFDTQEKDKWEPYLRGAIPLGLPEETYQPFVFLVSYEPDGPANDIWFSYYKNLRPNGRLKLGYGPGGPPVLGKMTFLHLIRELVTIGYLSKKDFDEILI